jgi:hypothetical protein
MGDWRLRMEQSLLRDFRGEAEGGEEEGVQRTTDLHINSVSVIHIPSNRRLSDTIELSGCFPESPQTSSSTLN